jgi:hypothetical protein
MSERELYIVEVDGFEGEQTRIELSASSGASIRALYCIAVRNEKTGVLQFVDYGYETLEDARAAWPDAN